MTPQIFAVSLLADDVASAIHFYRDVLRLPVVSEHTNRPHFDLGGRYLVLLPGQPGKSPERFPVIALSVDDLDARVRILEDHNIPLPWGFESDQERRWVTFYDPAGNLVELVESKVGGN